MGKKLYRPPLRMLMFVSCPDTCSGSSNAEGLRMMRQLIVGAAFMALTFACLAAQGAGIEAEHVVTHNFRGQERVEVGRWSEDELGRTRHDIDEWTRIYDPHAGVEWRANSKRAYSSKHWIIPRHARDRADVPGSRNRPRVQQEVRETDLGVREINGLKCTGILHETEGSFKGRTLHTAIEIWTSNAFGFPLRVMTVAGSPDRGDSQINELRNIVQLEDSELEKRFRPDENWKEVDGEVVRVGRSISLPFMKTKYKVTTTIKRRSDPRDRPRDIYEEMSKDDA